MASAVTTKMTRLRGKSPFGAGLEADAPFGHWRPQTFIAGLRIDELSAPWVLDSPMHRAAFDADIETQLAPTLQPGDVVIADNLWSHKSMVPQICIRTGRPKRTGQLDVVSATVQPGPEPD